MSTDTRRPYVWDSEDGHYYGEGHIDPARFKALAHKHDDDCLGPDHRCEDGDCSAEMDPEDVSHEWWYPLDPEDEETAWKPCEPDHPGATPWTVWRR